MRHYTDDDLTLYYYGEARRPADIERHLGECASCAATYRSIAGALSMVVEPRVPARGDRYGLEVWQRIRPQLPEQDSPWWTVWLTANRLALVGSAAALIIAIVLVGGRVWPNRTAPAVAPAATTQTAAAPDGRQRILLASVADHLDRSDRVLTDIMNSPDGGDISAAQRWADDLLATSRLYRQDAIAAGEQSVASVLDELERSLVEIVHSPSKVSAADLEQIRRRIDAAALLFKVRVMSDELRRQEQSPRDTRAPRTSTRQTS